MASQCHMKHNELTRYRHNNNNRDYRIIDMEEGRDYSISSGDIGNIRLGTTSWETVAFYICFWLEIVPNHTPASSCFWAFMITSLAGGLMGITRGNYIAGMYLWGTLISFFLPGVLFYLPLVVIGIIALIQYRN